MPSSISLGIIALVVAVRVSAIFLLPISDCDETYNFIEPQHFLVNGYGLQTWEYSQQYALRSYLYLWIYTWPSVVVREIVAIAPWLTTVTALSPSLMMYFTTRLCTALGSLVCEVFFVESLPLAFTATQSSSSNASLLRIVAYVLLLCAYPVTHASFSFLPTSFCMSLYFAGLACWIRATSRRSTPSQIRRYVFLSVACVLAVGIVGWPFAVVIALPIALHFAYRYFFLSLVAVAAAGAVLLPTAAAFDMYYYCRPDGVLAALNIVLYNVFGGEGRGPHLYGTEPWNFFFKNLLVNFGVAFVLALMLPLIALRSAVSVVISAQQTVESHNKRQDEQAAQGRSPPRSAMLKGRLSFCTEALERLSQCDDCTALWYSSPFYVWFCFWILIPHKEERFMVPAYPFLLLAFIHLVFRLLAARQTLSGMSRKAAGRGMTRRRLLGIVCLVIFSMMSFGRWGAIQHYYGDAQAMFWDMRGAVAHKPRGSEAPTSNFTICVGKEWFRFPTHFFLPSGATYRFLRTGAFEGALPKPFISCPSSGVGRSECASCAARPDLNDLNLPNNGQFVEDPAAECDAVWDAVDTVKLHPPAHSEPSDMDIVVHLLLTRFTNDLLPDGSRVYRLLDTSTTPMWCRVLYFSVLESVVYEKCTKWHTFVLRGV